jgi:hypothetical protein
MASVEQLMLRTDLFTADRYIWRESLLSDQTLLDLLQMPKDFPKVIFFKVDLRELENLA